MPSLRQFRTLGPAPGPSGRTAVLPPPFAVLRHVVGLATPGVRAAFQVIAALVACALLGLAYWLSPRVLFPLDDAYITLHNAEALIAGRDRNYLGVSPLIGATSLVHLALVTGLCTILSPVAASYAAGCLGVLAYTSGLAALTFRRGGSLLAAGAVVLLGLSTGYAPFQVMNGLETGLAMSAVTWAIVIADRDRPGRALPLLCGTLPFIRPELAVLSGLLMIRQGWLRRHAEGGAAWIRPLLVDLAVVLCAALPWMGWSFAATGTVLPNTADAKAAFFAESHEPYADRLLVAVAALARAGLAPVLLALCLARPNGLTVALRTFVAVVLGLFVWKFPGGLFHNYYRYCCVFLPVGLYGLMRMRATRSDSLGGLVLGAAVATALISASQVPSTRAAIAARVSELPVVAAWASRNLPADAVVLIHDAGYLAYATTLPLVDVVGLKTPDASATHRAITQPSGGTERARAIAEIAARHKATHAIILRDTDGFWNGIADDLRREGWRLDPLFAPDRPNAYWVYALTPPAA